MTQDVYCFYADLGSPQQKEIVPYWCNVWSSNGWTPHVLGMKDATSHPKFKQVSDKAKAFPTVNGPLFEYACFVRWCAFAKIEGAVTDFDVFPRLPYPPRCYDAPYSADPCGGPGLLVGTAVDFEHVVDSILSYTPTETDLAFGNPHVSDMTILQSDHHFKRHYDVDCYGTPKWLEKPLTHFGNAYLKGKGTKLEQIKSILENK